MQACIILACAVLTAAAGCATPVMVAGEGAANAPLPAVETQVATNHVADCAVTKAAVTNAASVKIVYPNVPDADFSVDDWAEELAEKGGQGLHIRNGQILVVARIPAIEGEHQMLAKARAKFRAIEILRSHYPDLPKEFSASCRILVCETSDSGGECVAVMAFSEKDILPAA